MIKRRFYYTFCSCILIAAFLLLGACSTPEAEPTTTAQPEPTETATEPAEIITIRGAAFTSKSGIHYSMLVEMAAMIEEWSDGQVQFDLSHSGALVTATDSLESTINGVVDISHVLIGSYPGRFPLTDVVDLPPAFTSGTDAAVMEDFFMEYLAPQPEWDDVKPLFMFTHAGSQILTADKPIRKLEDFQGLRIRAVGLAAKIIERLGGIPITLPPTEIYEAIQRGTIDGASIGVGALTDLKLVDVCKYDNETGLYLSTPVMVMNLDKYNSLPDDIKLMFDRLAEVENIPMTDGRIHDEGSDEARAVLVEAGGEVVYFDAEAKAEIFNAIFPLNAEWAEELEAQGYPAQEVLQAKYDFMKPYMPEVFE